MRRVLALARDRGEDFELEYTRIPPTVGSVREWRSFAGPRIVLRHRTALDAACVVRGAAADAGGEAAEEAEEEACAADEVALLPPPPAWLQHVLLPYPIPLVPSDTVDDIYCST